MFVHFQAHFWIISDPYSLLHFFLFLLFFESFLSILMQIQSIFHQFFILAKVAKNAIFKGLSCLLRNRCKIRIVPFFARAWLSAAKLHEYIIYAFSISLSLSDICSRGDKSFDVVSPAIIQSSMSQRFFSAH